MEKYFLAIDIGASSGRHILSCGDELKEVYRFPNGVVNRDGRLYWDTEKLLSEIKEGIKRAFKECKDIASLAIDTWGVDYVLMDGDREIMPCYAYRDCRGELASEKVHALIPFEKLYKKTGITYNSFNSIYQFYDDRLSGRLDKATDFLMLPEYFSYKLTGVKKHEYTNATTTGLLNCVTGEFDDEIISALGLKKEFFGETVKPGYSLGMMKEEIAKELGGNCEVVLCASHDTASAVYGIPMEGNSPYISSGTWSLLGIKTEKAITDKGEDISNEGGVGYFRHQKNIMGMWVVNRLRDTLDREMTFGEMAAAAENSDYKEIFDVNDESLFAPENMKQAVLALLKNKGAKMPATEADIISSVYHSLAFGYAETYRRLEENTGKTYNDLYIVGGGAKNQTLNRLTAEYSGKNVIALPIEATALGNIKIQRERFL